MASPAFSIIINTYNRAKSLQATLLAISRLRWQDFELIVVTGPSEDGTRQVLLSWQDRVKQVECDKVNLAYSRNVGLAHATGEWIVFTDDDALPEPDWLCRLAAHILANRHVKLGAVGGFVYDHTGHGFQAKYLVSDLFGDTLFNQVGADRFPIATDSLSAQYPSLMGVNVCYARKALMSVGGFDEVYAYLLEETDLILRLVQQGWQVHNEPSAIVHHKYADSHIRHEKKVSSFYHMMRSRAYFSIRHALPKYSLEQVAQRHSLWLTEVREHHPHLIHEAYYGLRDGMWLAQDTPKIKSLPPTPSSSYKPFQEQTSENTPMRILLVSGEYPPHHKGGIARFMHVLAKTLARLGHEVTVITRVVSDVSPTVDLVDGYWLHCIRPLDDDQLSQVAKPVDLPEMPRDIDAFAAAVWYEVSRIQQHRSFQFAISGLWNLETLYLQAFNLLPVFTYLVTSYHHMYQHYPSWQTASAEQMVKAEKWTFERGNLIAGSQSVVDDCYQQSGLPQILLAKVVPFGLPSLEVARVESESAYKGINLLFVGRFEPRKGVDLLLQLIPSLLAYHPSLTMTFIGNDTLPWQNGTPIKDQFLATTQCDLSRVSFLGEVSEDRLLQAYEHCDIFVAPSRYESFGLIFLEAMRAEKVTVGTHVGGIPEVIEDGCTGVLVQPNDVQSLFAGLCLLIDDEPLRKQMGKAARLRFEQHFTDEVFVEQLVEAIRPPLCLAA